MKHLLLTTIAAVLLVGCGRYSLHDAAREGNIETVRQHLDAGVDINSKEDRPRTTDEYLKYTGGTALHIATTEGHYNIVELLIDRGANVNVTGSRGSKQGQTPLHEAAVNGHQEIVELLIANSADINAKDIYSNTPLAIAVLFQNKEVAELLIAKGADVNKGIYGDGTLLDWTAKETSSPKNIPLSEMLSDFRGVGNSDKIVNDKYAAYKKEIATLLRKNGGKYSTILCATRAGDISSVEEFLDAGENINEWVLDTDFSIYQPWGIMTNPLIIAIRGGHKEIVQLLISNGADVNAQNIEDSSGRTPLFVAAYMNHKNIAELLIAKGADVNVKDVNGQTPLDFAVKENKTEAAAILRKHGGKTGKELEAEAK